VRALPAVLLIALAPHVAWSGGSGVIVLAQRSTRAAPELAAAMHASGVVRSVPNAVAEARSAVAGGAVPVETLRRFRRVREQIDDGWRAYHAVQFDLAVTRLAAARKDAEALLDLSSGPLLYADATLRLGVVLARRGRATEARDAIALALALDPDRPISAREFAPEFIGMVDTVRAEPRPKRSITVTTEPDGALLTVDGRDVGRAPMTMQLSVGQHVVVARLPQFRPRARAVAVTATATTIPIALERDELAYRFTAGLGGGESASEVQQLVDGVLLYADLDDVVVVAEAQRRGSPALLAQRCAGVPARCTRIVELEYGDRSGLPIAAKAVWQDVRTRELRVRPTLFADLRFAEKQRDAPACRLCRNPYVLVGAGIALVAGVVAIAVVATASRPPPVLTIDPSMFSR